MATMSFERPAAGSRHTLAVLVLTLIIDLIAFTCILPLFPSILDGHARNAADGGDRFFRRFEAGVRTLQGALGIPHVQRYNNVFFAGILGSTFSLLQYLSSPLFGALSDSFGRKPLLLLSICGSLFSYYLWFWSTNSFALFVASRIVGGLSKASSSVAVAVVADILPANNRGHGMALIGVSYSIAFVIGPAIGAYFAASAKSGISVGTAPASFAIGATFLELAIVLLLLPETLAKTKLCLPQLINSAWDYVLPTRIFNFTAVERASPRGKATAARLAPLRGYARLYFVYLFLYSALEFTLCFLTHTRFNYDGSKQGRLYVFSGFLMIAVQGGYIRRITLDQQRRTLRLGLVAIIPAFALLSVAYNQIQLYAGLALYAIASAIVVPCLTTLVATRCDSTTKGSCLGVFRSVGALARAFGPFFGSFLFWLLGATYCYALGAVLLIAPLWMLKCIPDDLSTVQSEDETLKSD